MDNFNLHELYTKHSHTQKISSRLEKETNKYGIKGLIGSARSAFVAACFQAQKQNMIIVLGDKEEAVYFYNDLCKLADNEKVLFFPSSFKRSLQYDKYDTANIILRTDVLNKISQENSQFIAVSYPEALSEKVISQKNLDDNTLYIKVNEKLSTEFVIEVLDEYNFQRVDFVFEPGQYSVRGGIIDIFSFSAEFPYRVDFFGDEVDSIRSFDIASQLSKAKFDEIAIIPNIQNTVDEEERIGLLDFISDKTILAFSDLNFTIQKMNQIFEQTNKKFKNQEIITDENKITIDKLLYTGNDLIKKVTDFSVLEIANQFYFSDNQIFEFNTSPQPDFNKNFQHLSKELYLLGEKGYKNLILSENKKQIERLEAIFSSEEVKQKFEFTPLITILHEGFIDHDLKIACFTDHQIFKRYHKFRLKTESAVSGKEALTLKELNSLNTGDFVVHTDHGIGIFGGLQTIDIDGKKQETIRLVYKNNDILFVSIHSLHRISKYKGKDNEAPKIYKLGSASWQKLKAKTKKKVKDIAKDLIMLYAKRKVERGFAFCEDSYLQHELESSFIYEDTPDQLKATQDIKQDMEAIQPMDRLVCGDVGFGKTEVAIRAAFKAVADSKQVAVLVPTTILAFQHYNTFKERLKDMPCNVDYISRFRTAKEQREVKKALEAGKIDILIGTHKLASKDIKFKDLGLLIIDEEQKFGVAVKDKLKQIKLNVDTLTLTATPIPRTMQFSLMGARDLSIIKTPPPNRYPIITELHNFNEDIIREAINYEIERNGQVFFIHNRVQNIYEVQKLIQRLCPDVRAVVAHGQMDGKELEKIMLDFINEEYGVLIATTIIESGLDIPNANTIIINNAQNFGLSDLHQLRGRVGRSNKKAFCHLLAPPPTVLPAEARRRLKAISDFSELGSGFNIALQDLDIRGAGNLLGGEQSGFISEIGYETYQRILEEALLELKENDLREIFKKPEGTKEETIQTSEKLANIKFVTDCQIDTDLELLFPADYIENVAERVRLYRELDNINDEEELIGFEHELIDRFGKLPKQSTELLKVVLLRKQAVNLGIEKILHKKGKMICYFVNDSNSSFYSSPIWVSILAKLNNLKKTCQLKENKGRLSIVFSKVENIEEAIALLKSL